MSLRTLITTGELIVAGEDDITNPLARDIQVLLPYIGDGTGGTVALGATVIITSTNIGYTQVLSRAGLCIDTIKPRGSRQYVAYAALPNAAWTPMDLPLNYPASRLTGAAGGGPHTHPISDIVDLQATLDGKADDPHSHAIADVTGLQAALDAKADDPHSHTIADTTGLQAALDAKADLSHTHAQADVTGLVAALGGKAATSHTHASNEIVSGTLDIARVPTGVTGTTVPFGNDARFSDSRTPLAHKASHQDGGADELVVTGLSGLLGDAQTPLAHKANHQSGGSDAIKLDDLAAPDDNTDLNASTSAHGLMQKYPGGSTNFLRADGTFAAPAGSSAFLRHAAANQTVAADTTEVAGNEYEIVANFTTEIAALGVLEIS